MYVFLMLMKFLFPEISCFFVSLPPATLWVSLYIVFEGWSSVSCCVFCSMQLFFLKISLPSSVSETMERDLVSWTLSASVWCMLSSPDVFFLLGSGVINPIYYSPSPCCFIYGRPLYKSCETGVSFSSRCCLNPVPNVILV
ncbi:hypothetical protein ASPWEDRAFT_601095 [Aspergillus wentii DTO 134E9]|uniref:Uncharacterized protein n=1 Tax=Aspergillus wentii DTO 134E9 TaxID=1073089 RepID=A0A1L9RDJ2_ASPWE|nr:uncharacterized protein ASPWEDRAFT_601095 [Aspergillus wentii DTO 134E9]OJJ33000.1 hypothetical protein ASPWEDRAFT_601095 [Aspergillus wentii DTO 134E9]